MTGQLVAVTSGHSVCDGGQLTGRVGLVWSVLVMDEVRVLVVSSTTSGSAPKHCQRRLVVVNL